MVDLSNRDKAYSVPKHAPVVNYMPNLAPTHEEDIYRDQNINSDTANNNFKDPNVDLIYPSFSREVLGKGLANLGDWEEDLLDGEGYEYIVRE